MLSLHNPLTKVYAQGIMPACKLVEKVMSDTPKAVTIDDLKSLLSYDPKTGEIRWCRSPGNNTFVGELAGCDKATRMDADGNPKKYRYIRVCGFSIPAPRIAWALHYGEWPAGRIFPVDHNPLNLKIDNLSCTRSLPVPLKNPLAGKEYQRAHRKEFALDWKDKYLRRDYGISLHDYGVKLVEQNGKCAICKQPETGKAQNGSVKALAVDHCHATNKVRGLLCERCNKALGYFNDDPELMREAIEYVNKYSCESPGGEVPPLVSNPEKR